MNIHLFSMFRKPFVKTTLLLSLFFFPYQRLHTHTLIYMYKHTITNNICSLQIRLASNIQWRCFSFQFLVCAYHATQLMPIAIVNQIGSKALLDCKSSRTSWYYSFKLKSMNETHFLICFHHLPHCHFVDIYRLQKTMNLTALISISSLLLDILY